MSSYEEALQATMAKRELDEKLAAAREEQRAVCAATLRDSDTSYADNDKGQQHFAVAVVETAGLDATPLADTIKDLRADAVNAARVVSELQAELERLRDIAPTDDQVVLLKADYERLLASLPAGPRVVR